MSILYNSSLLKLGAKIPLLYLAKYNRNLLKRISPTPVDVSLKVTEKCNSRCVTCNVWQEQSDKPELTFSELEEIFYQLKSVKIKNIGFYGGEALLRKDIGELLKKVKSIMPEARTQVTTNGLLLKNKAAELIDAGIDMVSVSLDGIGEVNDQIRGVPGYYEKAIEGIKELKRLDTGNKVTINTGATLVSQNIHQVPQMINLARELGIYWAFNLFDTSAYHFRDIDNPLALKQIDEGLVDKTIDYMARERKKYPETMVGIDPVGLEFARKYLKGQEPFFNCVLGYLRIYMDSYMNVYSGCWALPPVGNLKENSLKNILNSPQYKERLENMFDLKCPYCTCGYLINLLINSPHSGIRYVLRNVSLVKS
ncbi:radical SAM/SPASM domain-containing protein [Chloroflexota bacterium]